MNRLSFPTVSQNKILNDSWKIACLIDDRTKIYIFCDKQSDFEQVLELSPAIAREFPLVRELIFYVADKKWIIVPTDQIR